MPERPILCPICPADLIRRDLPGGHTELECPECGLSVPFHAEVSGPALVEFARGMGDPRGFLEAVLGMDTQ